MAKGTLNVILHGIFIFQRDMPDKVIAWIPKLDPDHVYRAGNWLGETELLSGSYALKGVDHFPGAKNIFVADRNLILNAPRHGYPTISGVHAKLTFPSPEKITSLRVAKIPLGSFDNTGDLAHQNKQQHMATLQVFSYPFNDDKDLMLRVDDTDIAELKKANEELKKRRPYGGITPPEEIYGHYWEPVFTGNYINLHIFSTEDHYEQPSHASDDFNTAARTFGYELRLEASYPASGIKDINPPPGVDPKETEDLAPRTLRMALLGRLVKENGDASQAWYGDYALGTSPHACGGATYPGT